MEIHTGATLAADVRKAARVLIGHRGVNRRLCKFAFTLNDASFYVFPYAAAGRYFYGQQGLRDREETQTFSFKDQDSSDSVPKLSIHQQGSVSVEASGVRAGPVFISPLPTLRGQHTATIVADTFTGLPLHEQPLRTTGSEIDVVLPADPEVDSGRVALYVNGREPRFTYDCPLFFTLNRDTLANPVHVGLGTIAQPQFEEPQAGGTIVIAGWDPLSDRHAAAKLLYIRGL